MPRKVTVKALAQEALAIMKALEEHKALYRRLDELTDLLRDADVAPYGLKVTDQFESKNTVWRATGVRRFVLERRAATPFKVRRRK